MPRPKMPRPTMRRPSVLRLDKEQKALAGAFAAIAVLIISFAGLSQGSTDRFKGSDVGAVPDKPVLKDERESKEKKTPTKGEKKAKPGIAEAPTPSLDALADKVDEQSKPSAPAPASTESATPSQPSQPSQEPAEASPPSEPTSDKDTDAPARRPAPSRRPTPAPKPAELTSARLRALPSGSSLDEVAAKLGPAVSTALLKARYGADSTADLRKLEPDGTICRYYDLAAGEPAPLARLCFDANGRLLTREFVAPQG